MTDQLQLGDKPRTSNAPEKYTVEQHIDTKRYFAVRWQAGEVTGLSGPHTEPPATADLPGLHYDANRTVLKHLTQDILDRRYARWIPDEELAS